MMQNFQDLYDAYSTDIYRYGYWLSGDSREAEDITSETFIRAWTSSSPIRTETLKAYLFTIARNVFLGGLRNKKHQVPLDQVYLDPKPLPEEVADLHQALDDVRLFLQTLPEIDRTAFILRVQHELSYAEISRVLEISITAAKVKVHRIRKKLLLRRSKKEVDYVRHS